VRANCYQMLSVVISCNQKVSRCNQNASKVNQKHSKIHQRYVRMHQKTPVFLIKYCHNKDLNVIGLRIQNKISKFEARNPKQTQMTEKLMTKTTLP